MNTSTTHKAEMPNPCSPIKITHLLHTMAYGGIETVLINWLDNAPADRLDIQIVVFENPGGTEIPFVTEAGAVGIVVKKIPWSRTKPLLKAAKALDCLLAEHGTEILHMHNTYAEIVGYISGRRNKLKMVSTIYVWAGKDFGFKRFILQKISALIIKRFDLLTVQCEKARIESEYWGFDKSQVKVLPSGYKLPPPSGLTKDRREFLREELGANSETVVVCNIARLYPEKGQARMLRIWKRVSTVCPHARLWIYGVGPLEQELKSLCIELELQDSVVFRGFAPNLLQELELCDIQLHPSYNEGIPIAICAGMAAALPIIATEVGGIPEVIKDGESGVLVGKDDDEAIERKTIELIADMGLRESLGREAKRFIDEEYSIDAAVNILVAAYEDLLQ